ncbi:hypothetical protein [Saccharopolyspora pogona]|uniref:hypothetical protein n=1 Tax=Saccharopolyspora pogona TaxID=333966 RepID=UPI0016855DFA|nr:hypothetical protein [Saccharopolyspora pogona]
MRHAEHGETVPVIAHGEHVADVVPSGELDRLRETIEVLSDAEAIQDLLEGLADVAAGRPVSGRRPASTPGQRVSHLNVSVSRVTPAMVREVLARARDLAGL